MSGCWELYFLYFNSSMMVHNVLRKRFFLVNESRVESTVCLVNER